MKRRQFLENTSKQIETDVSSIFLRGNTDDSLDYLLSRKDYYSALVILHSKVAFKVNGVNNIF